MESKKLMIMISKMNQFRIQLVVFKINKSNNNMRIMILKRMRVQRSRNLKTKKHCKLILMIEHLSLMDQLSKYIKTQRNHFLVKIWIIKNFIIKWISQSLRGMIKREFNHQTQCFMIVKINQSFQMKIIRINYTYLILKKE